jgi:DNA polymerase elongation subunit (family B)
LHAFTEVFEENLYPSLESRLPSLEYEKVFHLYLLSTLDQKVAFRKELKKVIARGIERVNSFLDEVFTQRD